MRNLLSNNTGTDNINYNPVARAISPKASANPDISQNSQLTSPAKKNNSFASSIIATIKNRRKSKDGYMDNFEA